MRDSSDKNSEVPHCPGIHRAVLTGLLNFAFVPPISLLAKLAQMRFHLSAEFLDEKVLGATKSSPVSNLFSCVTGDWYS